MTKWITAYEAAKIIGCTRQCIYDKVKRGRFLKGRMIYNKHSKRKIKHYRLDEVIAFADS